MKTRGTVAFDIIGTCFSLQKPRQRLVELGAPDTEDDRRLGEFRGVVARGDFR